jgi:hypothetical protein
MRGWVGPIDFSKIKNTHPVSRIFFVDAPCAYLYSIPSVFG